MEIKSEEECKIEGMPKVESKRRVTAMDTELSRDPLDETDPGYQQPEPKEENTGPMPNSKQREAKKKEKHAKQYNPTTKEKKEDGDTRKGDKEPKHEQDRDNHKRKARPERGMAEP